MSFHERVERDQVGLSAFDCVSDLGFQWAHDARAVFLFRQLGPFWTRAPKPALQFASWYSIMIEHGLYSSVHFPFIVFEADNKHSASHEDVLSAQWLVDCERDVLQQSQCGLPYATAGDHATDISAAKYIPQQPFSWRDKSRIISAVPFAELGGFHVALM